MWRSAETVRREWLAGFCSRKTPPTGAESLICEAVATGQYALTRAMQEGHRLLTRLLHPGQTTDDGLHSRATARNVYQPVTGKAATMRTLACVIAAWEESTSTQTGAHPVPGTAAS